MNVVLVTAVVVAIVGLCAWSIVSSMSRPAGRRMLSLHARRSQRAGGVTANDGGRQMTVHMPSVNIGDLNLLSHGRLTAEDERQVRDELSLLVKQVAEQKSVSM
ncbi:MAG TPA: hypothetical protein VMA77_15620 [Solirubrobacteraceae bacterium]|nr:hypothetical protein [Solirubrobacteraceae bacterium]